MLRKDYRYQLYVEERPDRKEWVVIHVTHGDRNWSVPINPEALEEVLPYCVEEAHRAFDAQSKVLYGDGHVEPRGFFNR